MFFRFARLNQPGRGEPLHLKESHFTMEAVLPLEEISARGEIMTAMAEQQNPAICHAHSVAGVLPSIPQ